MVAKSGSMAPSACAGSSLCQLATVAWPKKFTGLTVAAATRVVPNCSAVTVIAVWGTFGVLAILGQAIYRLSALAIEPFEADMLSTGQISIVAAWTVVSIYSEGYKGFHKAFAPRVVARAFHLAENPRPLFVLLAPMYCMAMFHATRKRLIFTYVFYTILIGVILIVHQLEQPWRGIVDAGVVAGLIFGAASILYFFVLRLTGRPLPVPPDVPEPAAE